jgi:acyl-[acyl-carrier-protein] desaturase
MQSRTNADFQDRDLVRELEPVVEAELNRHLSAAEEWFPHRYVPWSAGRNFEGWPEGSGWQPEQSKLAAPIQGAIVLNLLTEDNLPSYHHELGSTFGREGAWGAWGRRWSAEEDRHSTVIRDYLITTRAIDPVALERERMSFMSRGYVPDRTGGALRLLAYVTFQEMATRISHRNTGRLSGDPVCDNLLSRVARDENLHMLFYRNVLAAAFELVPGPTMRAMTNAVKTFQMPGAGLSEFNRRAIAIAMSGIYDQRIHRDEVIMPILRGVRVMERTGLGPDGERARDELDAYLQELDAAAKRFTERRDESRYRAARAAQIH